MLGRTRDVRRIFSAGLLHAGAPEGKELFTAKCQACHGANGEGKAAIGKLKSGQVYRPEREAEVLRHVTRANRGPLPKQLGDRFNPSG